jgi:hypothetical protein
MKKSATIFIFLMVSLSLLGKGRPQWMEASWRKHFPANIYYTGKADIAVAQDKSNEVASQLKDQAIADLTKQIHMKVTSESKSRARASSRNGYYTEDEDFSYTSQIESKAEVSGVITETHYDRKTGRLYAFAYVKQNDLTNFYRKQIMMDLEEAEKAIEISKRLFAKDEIMASFAEVRKAKNYLIAVYSYRRFLNAAGVAGNQIQAERLRDLQKEISKLFAIISEDMAIFLDCSKGTSILCSSIEKALSDEKYNFIKKREDANYELVVLTTTLTSTNGSQHGVYSCYANVKVELHDRINGTKTVLVSIYKDREIAYAIGRSNSDAAANAFNLPSLRETVIEKILSNLR